MIPASTKVLAGTLMVTSAGIFGYYGWMVAVMPWLAPQTHSLSKLFPDPYYAVAVPLIGVVLVLSAACVMAGVVILQASRVNYQKLHQHAAASTTQPAKGKKGLPAKK